MKRSLFFSAILFLLLACKKEFTAIEAPSLQIQAETTNVKVNEPVVFNFTGDADLVTFYSGLPGNEYQYKDRVSLKDASAELQLKSLRNLGAPNGLPDQTIGLYLSQNFNSNYNEESIEKADWVNLTDRASWSYSVAPNTTPTASGPIDLSTYAKTDAPVVIAFRYTDSAKSVSQREWTITEMNLVSRDADGNEITVANSSSMSWSVINLKNAAAVWTFTTAQIKISGGAAGAADNEDWIISKPLFLNRIVRDKGVSIKSTPTARLSTYSFAGYSTPGTYKVTFEIFNVNRWDQKKEVKEIQITVE